MPTAAEVETSVGQMEGQTVLFLPAHFIQCGSKNYQWAENFKANVTRLLHVNIYPKLQNFF